MRLVEKLYIDLGTKQIYKEHPKLHDFVFDKCYKPILRIDYKRTMKRTRYDSTKDRFYKHLLDIAAANCPNVDVYKEIRESEKILRMRHGLE